MTFRPPPFSPRGRPGRRAALILGTVLALAAGCTSGGDPAPSTSGTGPSTGAGPTTGGGTTTSGSTTSTSTEDAPESFVKASGTGFTVDGAPFRFVGANVYDAAASDFYSCDPAARMSEQELRDTFRKLHDEAGVSVIRFWAYQTYTKSGEDWSGIDTVVSAARDTGLRVLPVLEDGPGYCTTQSEVTPKSEYQGDTWFVDGYRANYGTAPRSFRDYAKIVVEHYRNEPVIFGWSLINEADTSARDPQDRSVLVDFAEDMAPLIKSADPNHLLTLGTQSNGARGASGPDFAAVYGVSGLDFAEVHDWGYWGDDASPMFGGDDGTPPAATAPECQVPNAPIACSFAQIDTLGKPLLVGEAGIARGDDGQRQLRAEQLRAKMDAAFAAGAAGYLVWRVTRTDTDTYDVVIGEDDPLFGEMAAVAAGLD